MPQIWTLNARGSFFLEVVSEYLSLSNDAVRNLITGSLDGLIKELASRGLDYKSTEQALIPHRGDRREIAFLFDTMRISSHWYGRTVAEAILPTLDKRLTCSVLVGDLIHSNQEIAKRILLKELVPNKVSEIVDTSQLYCVYLNNLTETMAMAIHDALKSCEFYFGYVDATYATPVKDWLSFTLINAYVKITSKFVCGHEDDAPRGTNSNMPGWPLEELGYQCFSVPSTLFDLLMNYKIERRVFKGFESDTSFSLNAISSDPRPMSEMKVLVEDAKLAYLRTHKAGSLELAGLERMTVEELSLILETKLRNNYIYNLTFLEEWNTSKFNLILEFMDPETSRPMKFLAVMKYLPQGNELRLVTLY